MVWNHRIMVGNHEFPNGSLYSVRREDRLISASQLVGYIHALITSEVLSRAALKTAASFLTQRQFQPVRTMYSRYNIITCQLYRKEWNSACINRF